MLSARLKNGHRCLRSGPNTSFGSVLQTLSNTSATSTGVHQLVARLVDHLHTDAGKVPVVPVTDNSRNGHQVLKNPPWCGFHIIQHHLRNSCLPRKEQDYTDTSLLKHWCLVIFNGYLSFWVFGLHASLSLFASPQCIREGSLSFDRCVLTESLRQHMPQGCCLVVLSCLSWRTSPQNLSPASTLYVGQWYKSS